MKDWSGQWELIGESESLSYKQYSLGMQEGELAWGLAEGAGEGKGGQTGCCLTP